MPDHHWANCEIYCRVMKKSGRDCACKSQGLLSLFSESRIEFRLRHLAFGASRIPCQASVTVLYEHSCEGFAMADRGQDPEQVIMVPDLLHQQKDVVMSPHASSSPKCSFTQALAPALCTSMALRQLARLHATSLIVCKSLENAL